MEPIFSLSEIPKEEYILDSECSGCGVILAVRYTLKIVGKDVLIVFNGEHGKTIKLMQNILLTEKLTPLPKIEERIVAFDEVGDLNELEEFIKYNNHFLLISFSEKPLTKIMDAFNLDYIAATSVSYPLDFINKIIKAMKYKKSFIQVLAPCPIKNGFDPSNTVEVGKAAVLSGYFPLYEIKEKEFALTFRPRILEPVKTYFDMQKNFKKSDEEIEYIQQTVTRNWKFMNSDKFWMTRL